MRTEKEIKKGLKKIEQIYLKEFGIKSSKDNSLHIDLTVMDVAKAIERIVRATEICTLKWILKVGGGLNVEEWQYSQVQDTISEIEPKPLTSASPTYNEGMELSLQVPSQSSDKPKGSS